MALNDGHRERLRRRFLNEGLDHFEPHEVIELLLFYVIPRGNVNHIAHRLINRFHSISGIFHATPQELLSIEGVGESSVFFLKLLPEVCRRYLLSTVYDKKQRPLSTSSLVHEYVAPHFIGRTRETLFLICLNNAGMPVDCCYISEGVINATQVDMRKIVEAVVRNNAVAAILCHNHPEGFAKPSKEDIEVTNKACAILDSIGVALLDHLIVVGGDYVSFFDSGHILLPEPPEEEEEESSDL